MMEGMPERVSAVIRTSLTSLLPRRAYSVSQMAAPMPRGTASTRAMAVISRVLMIAGSMDTLSLVYFQANSSGVRWGIPLMRI